MSNYINDCLNFIDLELNAVKKEMGRLLSLSPKKHMAEGQTIFNAKAIEMNEDGSTKFQYPAQFTKIREERKVIFYADKERVGEAEVDSIDYLSHEFSCYGDFNIGQQYLVIQSLDVPPGAIMSTLKELSGNIPPVIQNLIDRKSHIMAEETLSVENVLKTVDSMDNAYMTLQGIAGAGKTYYGSKIIDHLLSEGKSILITSNSHAAINNLISAISYEDFNGAKICSRPKHNTMHSQVKNIRLKGKDVDHQVENYDLIGGTCFALSRFKEIQYDFLIIDEASQLKLSYAIAAAKNVKNIIILGDQQQLPSISSIPMQSGGESVLDYLLKGQKIVPRDQGYFLNCTRRCSPNIANIISEVFYEGKATWSKTEKTEGIKLIDSNHSSSQKFSEEEGKIVLEIYNNLTKNNKICPSEIIIISPYNANVSYLDSLINGSAKPKKTKKGETKEIEKPKTRCGTIDIFQGDESDWVIVSLCESGKSKAGSEFVSNAARLNVAISRAKCGVFIIASKGLQQSKHTTPEFQKVLKMIA